MQPLIIIIGPTAVGKSALGIELAKVVDGEIISGDSVQVYKKLDIGSAKPSPEEQRTVKHHLIDFLDPAEPFTVAHFQALASSLIRDVKKRNKIPIIVGGTGLYVRSLIDDFDFSQKGSSTIKNKWLAIAKEQGNAELYEKLQEIDPDSAARLHPNDTSRIIRALEIYELTGKPFSEQRDYSEKNYQDLDPSIIYIGLTAPREKIYEKINLRCEEMVKNGLVGETREILAQGYAPNLKPLQSIGYRHAVYYLQGKITLEEMLRLLKRDTRHFAKRQLTWFKRDPRIKWYDINTNPLTYIINDIRNTCREIQTRVE